MAFKTAHCAKLVNDAVLFWRTLLYRTSFLKIILVHYFQIMWLFFFFQFTKKMDTLTTHIAAKLVNDAAQHEKFFIVHYF